MDPDAPPRRILDGYPDVALDMTDSRTFDARIQLVEHQPRVLAHPPLHPGPSPGPA